MPTLSVQDNLYLGREHKRAGILDKAAIARGTRETLDQLQFHLDPERRSAACRAPSSRWSRSPKRSRAIRPSSSSTSRPPP